MIFTDRAPEDFNKKFEVTSLFLNHAGKILLLLRQDHKPQGNTWGVPAGKIEEGENPAEAILRELREETGIFIPEDQLSFLRIIFVRHSGYDFIYHMYTSELVGDQPEPQVVIDPTAHKAFRWVTPEEALKMNLVDDLDECVKITYFK